MRLPPNHSWKNRVFQYNPSSYWGSPMTQETSKSIDLFGWLGTTFGDTNHDSWNPFLKFKTQGSADFFLSVYTVYCIHRSIYVCICLQNVSKYMIYIYIYHIYIIYIYIIYIYIIYIYISYTIYIYIYHIWYIYIYIYIYIYMYMIYGSINLEGLPRRFSARCCRCYYRRLMPSRPWWRVGVRKDLPNSARDGYCPKCWHLPMVRICILGIVFECVLFMAWNINDNIIGIHPNMFDIREGWMILIWIPVHGLWSF